MPINRPNVFSAGAATNTDLFLDAAARKLGDSARVRSFYGRNTDIDASPEYLTNNGSARAFNSSGYYDGIVSSSALDTAGGTGATKVFIEGIDAEGDLAQEIVEMNGTTPVSFANDYYWVNVAMCVEYGALGINVGTITLREGSVGKQTIGLAEGMAVNGGIAYPRGFYPVLQDIQVRCSRDSGTATAGDMQVWLFHVQDVNNDVVQNRIMSFDFPFSSLAQGVYTAEVPFLDPFHILPTAAQGSFENGPSGGYFYFQADGDAALNCAVSVTGNILFRDSRS